MRIVKDYKMNSSAGKYKMSSRTLINILCIFFILMVPLTAESDTIAPTVSILTPASGSSVSKPKVLVLVQVWDSEGIPTNILYNKFDGQGWKGNEIFWDSSRDCGTNCRIYRHVWDLSSYADNSSQRIRFQATDASPVTGVSRTITINVKKAKTGTGMLLTRDSSSQFCMDCHNIVGHSSMESHGSRTTASMYGNWETICLDCHIPHNTRNIDLVKDILFYQYSTFGVGTRAVKLYTKAGDTPNSFVNSALTGTIVNGVCQVCHTKTRNPSTLVSRWVATGNPGGEHYQAPNSERCSSCHLHTEGFRGRNCEQCHYTPPTTGKHPVHGASANYEYGSLKIDSTKTQYGFDCGICHNGIHQNTSSNPHAAEVIFAGVASQDLKSGLPFYTAGTPSETPGLGGYTFSFSDGTCSNTYCHGNYPGSGKNEPHSRGRNTLVSNITGTLGPCGTSCHDALNSDTGFPRTGSHERHVTRSAMLSFSGETTAWSTYNRGYSCTMCHNGEISGIGTPSSTGSYSSYKIDDRTKHVNGVVEWQFVTNDARLMIGSSFYSVAPGSAVPSDGVTPRAYGSCTVYCHSTVQNIKNFGSGLPSSYSKMTWTTARNRCAGCHVPVTSQGTGTTQHGRDISSGSHTRHYVQLDRTDCNNPTPCLICHQWNTTATVNDLNDPGCNANCNQCHDAKISATNELNKHVNGIVDIAFDTYYGADGFYNGTGTPGDGYGTCENTYCHSNGTSVSTGTILNHETLRWESPVSKECYDCHGNSKYRLDDYRKAAPMDDIVVLKPNAHQLHLRESGSTVLDPSCANCHYDTTVTNNSIASKLKHMDKKYDVKQGGSYSAWAGTYIGQTAPVTIGSFTFKFNAVDSNPSTCTNVSCHSDGLGGNKTAMWSSGYYCTECHNVNMNNATGYHHVMNSSALTSRVYPTTYPTSTANDVNRKCIMCHVDHILFNPMLNDSSDGRAYNLRTSIIDEPGDRDYYTNMDFDNNLTYGGICTSCHRNAMTKNTNPANQKTDNTTTTPVIDKAGYNPSSHNYSTISTFRSTSSGNFNANCSKCHNTGNDTKTFQNSTSKFVTHDNALRRLLSPLGIAAPVDPLEEKFCFRCHSTAANNIGGTKKSATVNDWYGAVTNMIARATDTFASFYNTPDGTPATKPYGHMLWNYTGLHRPSPTDETQSYISSNKHVECDDCHNVHTAAAPVHTQGVSTTGNNVSNLLTSVPAVTVDYTVAASSVLWLRETTPYESAPNATGSTETFQGGTWQGRQMLPTQGASFQTQTINVNAAGYWRMTSFVSPPVARTTVLPASTWTLRLWALESALSANAYMHATIYGWNQSDTKGTVILAPTTYPKTNPADPTAIVELTAGSTAYTWNVSGSGVTLNPGDRIVVELEIETTGAPAGSATYRWNGAGAVDDSKVTLPAPVSFVTYTAASAAAKEYEICFKCHSGANVGYSGWGGGAYNASPLAWTDAGVEFNPYNKSGHPVVSGLSSYPNASAPKALAANQLTGPWIANRGTQTMYCSDCHSTNSTVSSGPHASSAKWMLAGTNRAWPYQNYANNGTSAGTFWDLSDANRLTNLDNVNGNGLFCFNCHPSTTTQNNVHNGAGHKTNSGTGNPNGPYKCVDCHIRVPHGGKVSRLINADNTPTGNGLPARYFPNGNGGGRIAPNYLKLYRKVATAGTYTKNDCTAACHATHNSGSETW
jgi:predicted CxxxxCH...CXXCH cytochrome family protein